eukprot:gene368-465_t
MDPKRLWVNKDSFSGFSEKELFKVQNMIIELNLNEQVVSLEWETYATKKQINDGFFNALDKFKVELKKKVPKLLVDIKFLEQKEEDSLFDDVPMDEIIEQFNANNNDINNNSNINTINNNDNIQDQDQDFDFSDLTAEQKKLKLSNKIDYANRRNTGKVIDTYTGSDFKQSSSNNNNNINIEIKGGFQDFGNDKLKYMNDRLQNRHQLLKDSVQYFQDKFEQNVNDETNQSGDKIRRVIGRIWLDRSEMFLSQRFQLLGNPHSDLGSFALDTNSLPTHSLFTGQVVMVEGSRVPGSSFFCSKLYQPKQLKFLQNRQESGGEIKIIIASGPFCLNHAQDYSPFNDLCESIRQSKPQIAILMGPFIDQDNLNISFFDSSYESIFSKLMEKLIQIKSTKFLIVPSLNDVTAQFVFPQPPFKFIDNNSNLQFVSNPSTILINNSFTIGINNSLICNHLQKYTQVKPKENNTINNSCSMLINQQNYYPLHPAQVPIEMKFLNQLNFPDLTPDILLFSNETSFINVTNDVLCLSPGMILTSKSSGTYAQLTIGSSFKNDQIISNHSKVEIKNI